MNKPKAIIFDFGGVFTSSPVEEFFAFEEKHNLPKKFIGGVIKENHHTNAWAQFERAEMSREAFNTAFAEETKAAGYEITGDTLLSILKVKMKSPMIDLLGKVKDAGYKTGCITNNLPGISSVDMVSEQDAPLAEETMAKFDHVIESSIAGVRKPEAKIYNMMCEALNVKPAECVFLDDLGINLKGAQAVGMQTIKVPLFDVSPAVDELMALLQID